jgi:hypothetical protein
LKEKKEDLKNGPFLKKGEIKKNYSLTLFAVRIWLCFCRFVSIYYDVRAMGTDQIE